jgi:Uma2 family endonuclease
MRFPLHEDGREPIHFMTHYLHGTKGHTYADYLTWSGTYGDELIDGTAYIREPPAPARIHQEMVVELARQVAHALQGKIPRVFVAPFDVRLPKAAESDDQVDTVVQPDVLITCDRTKLDERGMRGAPDWIVEILSPTTAAYDKSTKLPLYERAGVREVWLIHPTDRTVSIHRLEGGHFTPPTLRKLEGQTPIAAVPDVHIDWDRLLANIG